MLILVRQIFFAAITIVVVRSLFKSSWYNELSRTWLYNLLAIGNMAIQLFVMAIQLFVMAVADKLDFPKPEAAIALIFVCGLTYILNLAGYFFGDYLIVELRNGK